MRSSINYAAKRTKTPYFFVVQPDVIGINKKALLNFYKYANRINKFSVLGPFLKMLPKEVIIKLT